MRNHNPLNRDLELKEKLFSDFVCGMVFAALSYS